MRKVHANFNHFTTEQEHQSRRQRLQFNQDLRDMVRIRSAVLTKPDQVLLEMILEKGMIYRQVACLLGCSETTVSRRVNRLVAKIQKSEYLDCLRYRTLLTDFQMRVAKEYFVQGHSQKDIAGLLKTSHYQVRKAIREIKGIVEGQRIETNGCRLTGKGSDLIKCVR